MFDGSMRGGARRSGRVWAAWMAVVALAASLQCGGGSTTGPTPTLPPPTPPGDPVPPGPNPPTPPTGTQIFVGAGDIAWCNNLDPAMATGRLIDSIGGTVFTLGDNAYDHATAKEFHDCYEPAWGRHKGRTTPVLGHHEYEAGADPNNYFDFFGSDAGPRGLGYYAFDLGPSWRAIALNSNVPSNASSAQATFLRNELASSRAKCTIAYWHHPLFTSGQNGPAAGMRDVWRILYDANAEIVLNGHDHLYERFAPQDPDGRPDPQRGMREFIVGSGGVFLYDFVTVAANSERRLKAFGVLKLTLNSDTYQWEFIQTSGAVADSGTGTCH